MFKNKYSFFILGFLFLIYGITFYTLNMWEKGTKGGDPLGYYSYLPATFIHGDLKDLTQTNEARGKHLPRAFNKQFYEDQTLVTTTKEGNKVIKYTCGLAITITPFFVMAHILAPILGYAPDGFSTIYAFFQYFAGFFYALWGLWLLRSILLRWYEDKWVALSLCLLALGTNLFFFVVHHTAMSHATLFFLHILAIHQTIRLYESQHWINSIGLGLGLGLIILIRPVEIFIVFIPLFWGVSKINLAVLKERLLFFYKHKAKITLVFFAAFVVSIPQFLYWRELTGDFIYYSYGNEGFNFAKPNLIRGLFGYQNGWLAYTPMMYFALIGLFFFKNKQIGLLPILLFLIPHIYLTYSWWCWYYINGYGSRPMVETYGLLSLPFTVYWIKIQKKKWLLGLSLVAALFFIYMNLFQTWQFYKGLYRTEVSKKEFFMSTLFKTELDFEDLILYDCGEWQPDSNQVSLKSTLFFKGFEKDENFPNITSAERRNGLKSWKLGQPKKWILLEKPVKELSIAKGDFISVNFSAMKANGSARLYSSSILSIRFQTPKGKGLKTRRIKLDNKIANPKNSFWGNWEGNTWSEIVFFSHVPNLPKDAVLEIFIEYNSIMDIYIYIDNVLVEVWESRKN